MRFEFAAPTRIIFGPSTIKEVPPLAAKLGSRALIVVGSDPQRADTLIRALADRDVESFVYSVASEPNTEVVRLGVQRAHEAECDLIIGFGGGSAIDTGKAISGLLTNPGDPFEYLEVVGQGKPLANPAAPYIAIPTTAGTGAEVTSNAVMAVPQHRVKVSLRSPLMLARVAVVDPELTLSLPPQVTASTGLDALTQLIEPFVSNRANPLTDSICREGMRRAARSLRRAWEHGEDAAAREDMAVASLFGGLALSNAKLGAVHGFAGPIGGMFPAPHGAICARLLPLVMETNVSALHDRAPESEALRRYSEVAELLTGHQDASAADAIAWLRDLVQALKIPPLATYGITQDDFPTLVEKAAASSSMQGNPLKLTAEELHSVLAQAL